MFALISPNEVVLGGQRVVEFQETPFPVAAPLFWLEIEEVPDTNAPVYYDPSSQTLDVFNPPEPTVAELRAKMKITPLQTRRALRAAGLLDTVEGWLSGQDVTVKEAWEYAIVFERLDPIVMAAATALGLTDAQIDDLFTVAATL